MSLVVNKKQAKQGQAVAVVGDMEVLQDAIRLQSRPVELPHVLGKGVICATYQVKKSIGGSKKEGVATVDMPQVSFVSTSSIHFSFIARGTACHQIEDIVDMEVQWRHRLFAPPGSAVEQHFSPSTVLIAKSELSQDLVCTDGTFTSLPFQAFEWRRTNNAVPIGGDIEGGDNKGTAMAQIVTGNVKLSQIAMPKGCLANLMIRIRCKSRLGWGRWSPVSEMASTVDNCCMQPPEVTASPTAHTVSLRWGEKYGGSSSNGTPQNMHARDERKCSQFGEVLYQVDANTAPSRVPAADIQGFHVDKIISYTLLLYDPHDKNCTKPKAYDKDDLEFVAHPDDNLTYKVLYHGERREFMVGTGHPERNKVLCANSKFKMCLRCEAKTWVDGVTYLFIMMSPPLIVRTCQATPDPPDPPFVGYNGSITCRSVKLHWNSPFTYGNGHPYGHVMPVRGRHQSCTSLTDLDEIDPADMFTNSGGDGSAPSAVISSHPPMLGSAETTLIQPPKRFKLYCRPEIRTAAHADWIAFECVYDGPDTSCVIGDNDQRVTGDMFGRQLKAETTYVFQLVAYNEFGESERSSNKSITTLPEAPLEAALPPDWVECWDPSSEYCFYFNSSTGVAQWVHPLAKRTGRNRKDGPGEGEVDDPNLTFRKKRFKLLHLLHRRIEQSTHPADFTRLEVSRSNVLHDSFRQMASLPLSQLVQRMNVKFTGEDGIDSGGLTREWLGLVSQALLSKEMCLFTWQKESGVFMIDTKSFIAHNPRQAKDYYRFFGRILSKAIYDKWVVDIPLCNAVYRALLYPGWKLPGTLEDLQQIDPEYARSLRWMLQNDITDVITETFSVSIDQFGKVEEVELVPGGKQIPVDESNKERFVSTVVQWRLYGTVKAQLESIQAGFHSLVSASELASFSVAELHLLFNGQDRVDVNELKRKAKYAGGFTAQSQPVMWFWQLLESFSQKQRREVLQFATGSTKVPHEGMSLEVVCGVDKGTQSLPTSHTCFNQLVLPQYESLEQLRSKLHLSLASNNAGFYLS